MKKNEKRYVCRVCINGDAILTQCEQEFLTLKEIQAAVGGHFETVPGYIDGTVLCVNDEGKLNGMKKNSMASELIAWGIDDVLFGDVLFCRADGEELIGLTKEQAQRWIYGNIIVEGEDEVQVQEPAQTEKKPLYNLRLMWLQKVDRLVDGTADLNDCDYCEGCPGNDDEELRACGDDSGICFESRYAGRKKLLKKYGVCVPVLDIGKTVYILDGKCVHETQVKSVWVSGFGLSGSGVTYCVDDYEGRHEKTLAKLPFFGESEIGIRVFLTKEDAMAVAEDK